MMNPVQRSRILIADHDQTFLDQLADRLLQMDMEVDFAENGKTAIQLIDSESYDLIVTEIAMPIYNGLEILRRSKERNPHIPILITTFSATTDWAEQAIREGAHSYLLRPLNRMKEFDLAVEDALQSKQVPDKNSFFEQVFSKGVLDDSSPKQADIPLPDWEKDLDHSLQDRIRDIVEHCHGSWSTHCEDAFQQRAPARTDPALSPAPFQIFFAERRRIAQFVASLGAAYLMERQQSIIEGKPAPFARAVAVLTQHLQAVT